MFKSVEKRFKSQKQDKKTTKPLKVLTLDTISEPSAAKPFFKFRTAEKGLYKAFRVSY